MAGYLYLMERADGVLKIGHTTQPRRRLYQVSYDDKRKYRYVRVLAGTRDDERALHVYFKPFRFGGHRSGHRELYHPEPSIVEWFMSRPAIDIEAMYAEICRLQEEELIRLYEEESGSREAR